MNTIRRYIESFTDCEYVAARNTMELMKDDGVCRASVRGGIAKKNDRGTLFWKNMTEVRRKLVEFCRRLCIDKVVQLTHFGSGYSVILTSQYCTNIIFLA